MFLPSVPSDKNAISNTKNKDPNLKKWHIRLAKTVISMRIHVVREMCMTE